MGLNHLEPAYTDQAAELIGELGGKFGGLEFLRTHVPALAPHILSLEIAERKNPRGYVETVWPRSGTSIVRASHRNDFQGLVDVLDTKIVGPGHDIQCVVDEIRAQVASGGVVDYARYEDPTRVRIVTDGRNSIVEPVR